MRSIYSEVVLADSPAAYYQAQEQTGSSLADTLGGTALSVSGGTVGFTPGPMNDVCTRHPGGTSSSRAIISNETTTWTMEIIAQLQAIGGDFQTLMYNGNSGSNGYGLVIGLSGSSAIYPLAGGVLLGSPTGSMTGGFDHIVLRRDGSNAWRVWLNGADSGAGGMGTTGPGTPSGNSTVGGSSSFQFAWTDFAFYSTNLSDARIIEHYSAFKSTARTGMFS